MFTTVLLNDVMHHVTDRATSVGALNFSTQNLGMLS